MKKLLMGAIVLSSFALSICLVQISCSKSNAQSSRPTDNSQLNKIVYLKDSAGKHIWTANYDGSNAAEIPLTLPANVVLDNNVTTTSLAVSPDGQTVFFTAAEAVAGRGVLNIYSCDISGSNLRVVIPGAPGTSASHHPVAF